MIPGASVVVTNKATGTKFNAVTSGAGTFTVPSLDTGVYTVSVSLMGFKTAVVDDVQLQPGSLTDIRAILEVGRLEESVTVTGAGAELVNTQTPAVTATLNVDQISAIPTPTRNVLNAVTYLVGVNQTGIARGAATVNRPARVVPEHHPGRRQQQRHVQQVERRLLRAGPAAPGCDRGR